MNRIAYRYILAFFCLYLSYGICFLTWFPGVGMNDGLNVLKYGMSASSQHPVLYVGSVTAAKQVGQLFGTSLDTGIAFHVLTQMAAVCALTAVLVVWILNRKLPGSVKTVLTGYYIFHPLVAIYSVTMVKDTLFSLVLAVYALLCYELSRKEGSFLPEDRPVRMFFILSGAFLIVWRNNGRYVVLPLLIILYSAHRDWRKWLRAAILTAAAAVILHGCLTSLYHQKPLFQEAVGIPLQQVCRVVAEDGVMTEEQKDFLDHLMPLEKIKKSYNPRSSDHIKWDEDFQREYLNKNRKQFLKVWSEMMKQNFGLYCRAFLDATYYFWHPAAGRPAQCFFTITTTSGNAWLPEYIEENGVKDLPVIQGDAGEWLRNYYHLAVHFFSEAVLFWLMVLLTGIACLRFRCFAPVWSFLPLFLLWGTIMISTPVAGSMRYVLAFVYTLPVFLAMALSDGDHGSGRKDGSNSAFNTQGLRFLFVTALITWMVSCTVLFAYAPVIDQRVWGQSSRTELQVVK